MNQIKTNSTIQRINRFQILWAIAAGQRSFGKAKSPMSSRASIPPTITYTGTTGAAGHSLMFTAPAYTEQRHLEN